MRRGTLLAIVGIAALLGGAIWWRSRPVPSDEERIQILFEEAARAVGEKRVGDAVAGVSERFAGEGGWGRDDLRRVIAGHVLRGEWLAVSVTGSRIAVDGDRARAVVQLVAARSGRGRALADLLPQDGTGLRLDAELRREEDGRWRVVAGSHRQLTIAEALAPLAQDGPH